MCQGCGLRTQPTGGDGDCGRLKRDVLQCTKAFGASPWPPLSMQVPNLMRALGYYPSEKEIQNMTYEIYTRFEKIIGSEDIYIDFETFIR